MQRANNWLIVAVLLASLPLSACSEKRATPSVAKPAKVERLDGSGLSRVTLSLKAAERLAIKTDAVRDTQVTRSGRVTQRSVLPHAAMLYDPQGNTWAYTNPEPLVFIRHRLAVDYIDGEHVVLSDGPPTGTKVVTVGAAELFGIESGLGK
jgi:hypothetical protein